jgi:DNA-binding NarL/FixJ family response regulator
MPHFSGLDFLAQLRSSPITSTLPFIFLTAKGLLEDRIRGYDFGTDGYLMKPFDPEELVVMLDKIVERKDFIEKDQHILSLDELSDDLKEVKELLSNKNSRDDQRLMQNSEEGNHSYGDKELVVLTQDELKVLELLCRGYMNREIATDLGYSIAWVEKHLTDLYRKTGQSNRTTLVRWAIANQYVEV